MADLGEVFDGSVYMEIGGDRAYALGDPIRTPMDGRAIFANMASRFAGAPASRHASLLDQPASNMDLGEVFDGSKIDLGPRSAIEELSTHHMWTAPMASTFLAFRTIWSAAVICPACFCGAYIRWP